MNFFTNLFMLMACCCLSLTSYAQITITQADFPAETSFIDSASRTTQAGIPMPGFGINQTWNYSALMKESAGYRTYDDAASSNDFPTAYHFGDAFIAFPPFAIPADQYYQYDTTGYYSLGSVIYETTLPITALSGGPNDILYFPRQARESLIQEVKFPMTYGDNWSSTPDVFTYFELTVAGFGLNSVPGYQQSNYDYDFTVVGAGTLVIPSADGVPGDPADALLIREVRTVVDSFFLGGQPAPAALLSAFSLVQGATAVDTFYHFYRKGAFDSVLKLDEVNGEINFAAYRPRYANLTSAIDEQYQIPFSVYPNPVKVGENLQLQSDQLNQAAFFSLVDIQGREVHNVVLGVNIGQSVEVSIPTYLNQGMYFYQLQDEKGNQLSQGKLMIE